MSKLLEVIQNWDIGVVRAFIEASKSNPYIEAFGFFAAEMLIIFFIPVLYWLWKTREPQGRKYGNKKAVVLTLLTLVFAISLKTVIAVFYARVRPFAAYPDLLVSVDRVDPQSFPSAHVLLAMTITASLYFSGMKRLSAWLLVATILIGMGRIMIGAHYPSDVIGALVLATIMAWVLHHESSSIKRYLPDT